MRLSLYAIERVQRLTEETRMQLERNLHSLENSAASNLGQIKENAAVKCQQELETFNNYVKAMGRTLNGIEELMTRLKSYHEYFNQ